MDDATMRLHCPDCRAIDWSLDGFRMTADINGGLNRIRFVRAKPASTEVQWTCGGCGHQATPQEDLTRHLFQMQVTHVG